MEPNTKDPVIQAVNAPPKVGDRGYDLDPSGKAAAMSPAAGPIVRILADKALSSLVEGYQQADRAAIDAQKQYRRWHWCSIMARYGIIILGILALTFAQSAGPWLGDTLRLWLGAGVILQLVLLLAVLLIGLHTRATRPLERWMQLRSFAEVKRMTFFDAIMRRQEPAATGELALLPLKLEFMVRYLLEPQLDYFQRRARELGRGTGLGTASLVILIVLILYTLAQVGLGLAALLNFSVPIASIDPQIAMGRALVGAAFAVLLASTTLSRIDERNALRYRQTADNLNALNDAYLPIARTAATAGEEQTVQDFVRLVAEQVGFGSAEWLSLEDLKALGATTTPSRSASELAAARRFLTALG